MYGIQTTEMTVVIATKDDTGNIVKEVDIYGKEMDTVTKW